MPIVWFSSTILETGLRGIVSNMGQGCCGWADEGEARTERHNLTTVIRSRLRRSATSSLNKSLEVGAIQLALDVLQVEYAPDSGANLSILDRN
jgi:hypothetical protein